MLRSREFLPFGRDDRRAVRDICEPGARTVCLAAGAGTRAAVQTHGNGEAPACERMQQKVEGPFWTIDFSPHRCYRASARVEKGPFFMSQSGHRKSERRVETRDC